MVVLQDRLGKQVEFFALCRLHATPEGAPGALPGTSCFAWVGGILLLPQIATMEHSLQVIRGMRLWAVALAVLAQILAYLGNGYLLGTLVAVTGEQLSVLRGTVIFTAAASVGLSGGGLPGSVATTYRWTHQRRGSHARRVAPYVVHQRDTGRRRKHKQLFWK
jgi:uncharacterized membrane protein YbhN (UPF0104 family)